MYYVCVLHLWRVHPTINDHHQPMTSEQMSENSSSIWFAKFHNSLSLERVVSNFFWVSSVGLFSPPKNLNLFEWWVNYKIQATHNQDALLYYHQNPLEKHAVTNIPHNESEQQDMTMCQILIYFFIVCFISRQVAIWETLFYFLVTFQKQNKIFRTYLYWDKCWNLETANLEMLQLGHLI